MSGRKCAGPSKPATSDNSHVVYNANPEGIPNVYSAQLPKDFLASLE